MLHQTVRMVSLCTCLILVTLIVVGPQTAQGQESSEPPATPAVAEPAEPAAEPELTPEEKKAALRARQLAAPPIRQSGVQATGDHGHDEAGDGAHAAGDHGHASMGKELPLVTVIPFILLLVSIAIFPLFQPHWWEHNENKGIIAGVLAVPILAYLLYQYGGDGGIKILHLLMEYLSFIVLLAALYVISGGIYIKGSLNGTPLANTGLLLLGALIASFIGTTGASVLLIRPLLRANQSRVKKSHIVVFFIFIVSNCGGLLTPLGDPPLFLGFLKGVPFTWTFTLWREWLVVNIALLAIFQIWDQLVFAKEEKERPGSQLEEVMKHEPLSILGGLNFLFLLGVVITIYFSGQPGSPIALPFVKEAIMASLAVAAYLTTASSNRQANNFTFAPIIEVAVLFVGIFITMGPALDILNAWGSGNRADLGAMPVKDIWHYFWATGVLSSFLDNAPTYLTFGAVACGEYVPQAEQLQHPGQEMGRLLTKGPQAIRVLAAISCGAVFMGANTYIGNGPNFMVKAIAEENGVKMPSFFGYMLYSGGVLVPILIVVTLLFFR